MWRKRLDKLTTVLSWAALGLGVAGLAAWPVSYWRGMEVGFLWSTTGRADLCGIGVEVGAGGLGVHTGAISDLDGDFWPFPPRWQSDSRRVIDPSYPRPAYNNAPIVLGCSAGAARLPWASTSASLCHEAGLVAPLWAWALVVGLLPARRIWRRRRQPAPAFEVIRPTFGDVRP